MQDLISRQAAIDALCKAGCGSGYCGISCDDVKAIEQLPSIQQGQQWIPCSERLPEEEKRRYWVCTDTGYQCQCRWTNDVYGLGASDRWEWKIFDIPQYQKVTAWMPLPEPYEDEGEK